MANDAGQGKGWAKALQYASVGLEMGIAVAIGWGVGYWLDGKLGTKPWLMIVGLLLGIGAGFKGLYDTAKKAMKDEKGDKASKD